MLSFVLHLLFLQWYFQPVVPQPNPLWALYSYHSFAFQPNAHPSSMPMIAIPSSTIHISCFFIHFKLYQFSHSFFFSKRARSSVIFSVLTPPLFVHLFFFLPKIFFSILSTRVVFSTNSNIIIFTNILSRTSIQFLVKSSILGDFSPIHRASYQQRSATAAWSSLIKRLMLPCSTLFISKNATACFNADYPLQSQHRSFNPISTSYCAKARCPNNTAKILGTHINSPFPLPQLPFQKSGMHFSSGTTTP